MLAIWHSIGAIALHSPAPPDYLTEVVSPVYEAAGSPSDLAAKGEACIAEHLRADASDGSVILSRDHPAGVVIAANALEYRDGSVPWRIRSRLRFEAREGRFRLTHTSIERHNDQSFGANVLGASSWGPVGKWWGSGWQKAQQALEGVSGRVSVCVINQTQIPDDW